MTVAVAELTSLKQWQAATLRSNTCSGNVASPPSPPQLLLAIDAKVDQLGMLAAGAIRDAKVIVLPSDRDGIEQITETLRRYPTISSLHLVAHGAPGCVFLGNTQLSLETIEAYAGQLQSWFANASLLTPRSLQIYACHAAAEDAGAALMQRLHQLTGATIAASTRTIGQAEKGGTWTLNAFTPINRAIACGLPFLAETLAAYPSTLSVRSIGSAPSSVALGITVVDGYAYVADEAAGIKVFDIRNPTSPQLNDSHSFFSGTTNDDFGAFNIAVSGNFAYVAHGLEGLQVFEITEVNFVKELTLVGSGTVVPQAATSQAYSVAIAGNYAYVAAHQAGLQVFDISDPRAPRWVTALGTNSAFSVAIAGDYAYIADGVSGLQVVDIRNRENPTIAGSNLSPGFATGVAIAGNFAYVASRPFGAPETDGLYILNISDPTRPSFVSRYDAPTESIGVAVQGNYAYIADGSAGVEVVDIRDPQNPQRAAIFDTNGRAYGLGVAGNRIFVADGRDGIKILSADLIAVSATTPNGAYNAGDSIDITVTFDQVVTVTGQPQLRLETGTVDQIATLVGGNSSSNTLTFRYTVQAGDNSPDLDIASSAALELNGGTIRYSSGDDAGLTLPTANTRGSLAASKAIVIDTIKPTQPTEFDLAADSDTGRSATDNITNDTTPTFSGTGGTVGDTVTLYTSDSSGNRTAIGSSIVSSTNWTVTAAPALAEGVYSIAATFTDRAGNESDASDVLNFELRTTPATPIAAPSLSVLSDRGISGEDNITDDNTPTFVGVGTANTTVQILANNTVLGQTSGQARWIFTPTAPLTDGNYSISFRTIDVAGNVSAASPTTAIVIDTQAPTGTFNRVTPKLRDTAVESIDLQFNEAVSDFDLSDVVLTLDGQVLSLNGATLRTTNSKTWTIDNLAKITQPQGSYQLSLKLNESTDAAGNLLATTPIETWTTGYLGKALPEIKFDDGKSGQKFRGRGLILGSPDRDVLRGLGGRNFLWGRNGSDVLIGGSGKDDLRGGRQNDRLMGRGGKDALRAGRGDDLLMGGQGNDLLNGGGGNDLLVGGLGSDVLIGNLGQDTFVFTSLEEAGDRIRDFASDELIDLRGIFAADNFKAQNDFSRFSQFVELEQVGADVQVSIDRDGNGEGKALTTLVTIENVALNSITSSRFVIS